MTVRTSYRLVHNQIFMRCTIITRNHINVHIIMMRLIPKYYVVAILKGVEAWWVL
jgi:hypothetical protein